MHTSYFRFCPAEGTGTNFRQSCQVSRNLLTPFSLLLFSLSLQASTLLTQYQPPFFECKETARIDPWTTWGLGTKNPHAVGKSTCNYWWAFRICRFPTAGWKYYMTKSRKQWELLGPRVCTLPLYVLLWIVLWIKCLFTALLFLLILCWQLDVLCPVPSQAPAPTFTVLLWQRPKKSKLQAQQAGICVSQALSATTIVDLLSC